MIKFLQHKLLIQPIKLSWLRVEKLKWNRVQDQKLRNRRRDLIHHGVNKNHFLKNNIYNKFKTWMKSSRKKIIRFLSLKINYWIKMTLLQFSKSSKMNKRKWKNLNIWKCLKKSTELFLWRILLRKRQQSAISWNKKSWRWRSWIIFRLRKFSKKMIWIYRWTKKCWFSLMKISFGGIK